jgi:NAD(P)-dependent dehydrogenase (short-subunit alcohol dehydrogenase family)
VSVVDRFRLDGRVAVVTGASSGLGVAFAVALAEAGADLVVGARRVDQLAQTRTLVEQTGRRCVAVGTDVTRAAECVDLVARARDTFGRVDVLVNNAGVGGATPALRETPEMVTRILAVNVVGAHTMSREFARVCVADSRGGSIVNVSSVLAFSGSDVPQAAYSASKAAVLGLTRDLAMQWSGRYGIRVNALAPSFIVSEMTEPLLTTERGRARVLNRTPMGRVGSLDDVTGPLLLLASDAGSYLTGVTLPVDGGWSLH